MGYAIADEAARRGARVTLVSGPTALPRPAVAEFVSVRSAAEMHAAVMTAAAVADVVVMAAAVADYAPAAGASTDKIEKGGPLTITLERTMDILASLGAWRGERSRPLLIGFAAQTGDPVPAARRKLQAKQVDLIVANDVTAPGAGFDVDTNEVTLVSRDATEHLPLMPKTRVAGALLDRIEQKLLTVSSTPAAP